MKYLTWIQIAKLRWLREINIRQLFTQLVAEVLEDIDAEQLRSGLAHGMGEDREVGSMAAVTIVNHAEV